MTQTQIADLIAREPLAPWLKRLRDHHAETFHHSVRVANWSMTYARRYLDLDAEDFEALSVGALMHDVGKLRIPREILAKPGPLDDDEWEQMRRHPRMGFELMEGVLGAIERDIIVGHHELKPAPYPRKAERKGDSGLLIEIVAVADIYDALRYRRAYKAPMPPEEVKQELKNQFLGDPRIPEGMVTTGSYL